MSAHPIHHVTAVTGQIDGNLEFYTKVLGLRLVKRSVNQDDVSAYHLFYADAVGSPGTDLTFFDWPAMGAGVPGAGTIAMTTFRTPSSSLGWWEDRLKDAGCPTEARDDSVLFADPEGQRLEIVADDGLPGIAQPWTQVVPAEHALRGILGVDIESARPEATANVLTEVLGFEGSSGATYVAEGDDSVGRVRLVPPGNRLGRVGAGSVHHVAFRAKDDDELYRLQEKTESKGLATSGYVDRFWFHSLYFREPGGVLFEIATDGPGFGADEDMEHLGEKLVLPPFLEADRARIERGLMKLA